MRRSMIIVVITLLLTAILPLAALAESIPIYIDGVLLETDVPAAFIDGNTMAPLRAVFEAFGANVEWDDEIKTALGQTSDRIISLSLGSQVAYVNGTAKMLPIAPQVINERVMVPLRFVAESLGAVASYDPSINTISIETTAYHASQTQNTDVLPMVETTDTPTFEQMVSKAQNIDELSYVSVVTISGEDSTRVERSMKGDYRREEGSLSNGLIWIFIGNASTNEGYIYFPTLKNGQALTPDEMKSCMAGFNLSPTHYWTDEDGAITPIYVAEDAYDNKNAYVFDCKGNDGNTSKVWFWAENGLMLKYLGVYEGKMASIQFMDVKVGGLNDSFFVLPSDITLIDREENSSSPAESNSNSDSLPLNPENLF